MEYNMTEFKNRRRLRNEDYEDETKYCPSCSTANPDCFYVSIQTDECVGCSDCINVIELIDY